MDKVQIKKIVIINILLSLMSGGQMVYAESKPSNTVSSIQTDVAQFEKWLKNNKQNRPTVVKSEVQQSTAIPLMQVGDSKVVPGKAMSYSQSQQLILNSLPSSY